MSINYDAIMDKFILLARDSVGSQLTQIGPVGSEFGAVIRARQGGPKPDFPYITIDVINTVQESGWLAVHYLDESENTVYETTKQLLLNYRVYGGNAISIANDLEGYFRLNSVLGDVRSTTGGSVVETRDVDQQPIELADKFLESSSFNIIFNITDTYSQPNLGEGVFDTVTLDGELNRFTDDPSPLDADVSVGPPL